MISEEAVRWGYRFILGREPESEQVVSSHTRLPSLQALRESLLTCPEFLNLGYSMQFPPVWVTADVLNGSRRMRVNLGDTHVSLACLFDCYEPLETEVFRALLRQDHLFLDIGANIGWYTLVASKVIDATGRIIAFEPSPEIAGNLRRTIIENDLRGLVDVREVGLAEAAGSAMLAWNSGTNNLGGSHLGQRSEAGFEHTEVALVSLDDLKLDRCDIIKMDIEGAEYRAINGGERLLRTLQPIVISELHPEQLRQVSDVSPSEYIARMIEFGYHCRLLEPGHPPDLITDFPVIGGRPLTNVVFTPPHRSQEVSRIIYSVEA